MIFARKNNFQKNAKKFEKSFKKVLTKGKWCGNIDKFASEPPGSKRTKYVFKRRVSKLSILNLKRKPREIDRNGDEVLK